MLWPRSHQTPSWGGCDAYSVDSKMTEPELTEALLDGDDGSGQIVQVDTAGGEVTPVADAMTEGPECAPAVEGTPAEAPRAPDAEMAAPEA
jgi:hypothetical protein